MSEGDGESDGSVDSDVDEMSHRERLTRAQTLQAAAACETDLGDLAAASVSLKEALRFLREVDEDSPKEAQLLRAAILAASKEAFHAAQTASSSTAHQHVRLSAAQAAYALNHAVSSASANSIVLGLLEGLAQAVSQPAGASDFCDAGGLPPLLQVCSGRHDVECTLHALEAVRALSSIGSMVPALCLAGAQGSADGNCLWWLSPSLQTTAMARRLGGLRIMASMTDTTGLDGKQQTMVQAALRSALTCPSAQMGSSDVMCIPCHDGTENMMARLQSLLATAIDKGGEPAVQVALIACTCFRNLARDAELRQHFQLLLPLLVRVCFLSKPSPILHEPGTAAASASPCGENVQPGSYCNSLLLLAALECLINCMSNSAGNRAALLNASHSITCNLSSAKWGFGLKSLNTPLILTKVATQSQATVCGLMPGDIVVRVGEHVDYGESLAFLQQALREGGAAEVELQRTGVGILAGGTCDSISKLEWIRSFMCSIRFVLLFDDKNNNISISLFLTARSPLFGLCVRLLNHGCNGLVEV